MLPKSSHFMRQELDGGSDSKELRGLSETQETQVQSPGWEDLLGKGMIPWTEDPGQLQSKGMIPWTEDPGQLQSVGLQRVGHD